MTDNITVADVVSAIETFAPRQLQESYDNSGLQIGNLQSKVDAVLLCLDVTEETLREAVERECNMVVSHHPLLFRGLKQIAGLTPTQRMVEYAIRHSIAIYSAHTSLDSTVGGISAEMARMIGVKVQSVLEPKDDPQYGLGVVGNIQPMPTMQFLRKLKDAFGVKALRYSRENPKVVIRRIAICGGSGASMIQSAIKAGADIFVTGDIKYHDYTTYAEDILLADIGHYEGELCARRILAKVIQNALPDTGVCLAETEVNPVAVL